MGTLVDGLLTQLQFFDDEEGGLFLQLPDSDDAYAVAYWGSVEEIGRQLREKGWRSSDVQPFVEYADLRGAETVGYFSSIEVQSARGLGLGWRMVERMLAELRARGVSLVFLHSEIPALAFWQRQGFKRLTRESRGTLPILVRKL